MPGAGLLVMRLVTGAALAVRAIAQISDQPPSAAAELLIMETLAGAFMVFGFWTPIASGLVAVLELGRLVASHQDPWVHILLATLAAGLALLGPGAWSIDARLFGWKRIDIPDRRNRPDIPKDV